MVSVRVCVVNACVRETVCAWEREYVFSYVSLCACVSKCMIVIMFLPFVSHQFLIDCHAKQETYLLDCNFLLCLCFVSLQLQKVC